MGYKRTLKCEKTFVCDHHAYTIVFDGYSLADLSQVRFYTYQPDSSFLIPIDSTTFTDPVSVYNVGDKKYYEYGFENLVMVAGMDYKIVVPHTNKVLKIYGIAESNKIKFASCDYKPPCYTITTVTVEGGNDAASYIYLT